jgi:hypothetical protein
MKRPVRRQRPSLSAASARPATLRGDLPGLEVPELKSDNDEQERNDLRCSRVKSHAQSPRYPRVLIVPTTPRPSRDDRKSLT